MAGIETKALIGQRQQAWRRLTSRWLHRLVLALTLMAGWLSAAPARAQKLEELPLERWARLGEADRFQLNASEKYFRENNWKAALSEYEKFLALYEKSEGAPFAQLKWSMCQVNLRKQNTAIKDGFQSVIDYWPDSPEAVSAAYLIGKTYKDMAEFKQAKKAYGKVLADYANTLPALLTKIDLADIARSEQDDKRRLALWNEVVFNTDRKPAMQPYCVEISNQLAGLLFSQGDFAAGLKSLATSYPEKDLSYQIYNVIRGPVQGLTSVPDTKARGQKLATGAETYIRTHLPAEVSDDAQKNAFRQMHYWIAEIAHYAGQPDEAAKAYDEVLDKLGADDDTLNHKAQWLKQVGKRDEARTVFRRLQNETEGLHQVAYSFREEQKYGQAIPIYQQLVTSDAAHGGRWNFELAQCYRDAGQFKEAIAVFRQCDQFPEDARQIAYCHRRLGETKEALVMYQQIVAGNPASAPGALLEIARTYEEANQTDAAIKAFQAVCKRYPKSGEASQAHARLQDNYKINATLGGATDE